MARQLHCTKLHCCQAPVSESKSTERSTIQTTSRCGSFLSISKRETGLNTDDHKIEGGRKAYGRGQDWFVHVCSLVFSVVCPLTCQSSALCNNCRMIGVLPALKTKRLITDVHSNMPFEHVQTEHNRTFGRWNTLSRRAEPAIPKRRSMPGKYPGLSLLWVSPNVLCTGNGTEASPAIHCFGPRRTDAFADIAMQAEAKCWCDPSKSSSLTSPLYMLNKVPAHAIAYKPNSTIVNALGRCT